MICPLPSTIMQKIKTSCDRLIQDNVQNPYFWHLIPRFRYLKKIPAGSLLLLYWPQHHAKFYKKTNERSVQYSKTDHRPMDRITDCQTDKGDYNLTHQVNHGPK